MKCPICKEAMVPSRIEDEEGNWTYCWLCACNEELRKRDDSSPVLCSVGLEGFDFLKNYAKAEQEKAEGLAKQAEGQGDTNEAIAWNHTAMAYADIICEIEKAA